MGVLPVEADAGVVTAISGGVASLKDTALAVAPVALTAGAALLAVAVGWRFVRKLVH